MQEIMRNRVMLILSILTVIFFIGTVNSCNNAHRQKSARDKEMASRLDIEEKYSKAAQEKSGQEEKIRTIEKELEEEKAAEQAMKKALVQEQMVNQSLKEELAKVTKQKEALEEQLKQAGRKPKR